MGRLINYNTMEMRWKQLRHPQKLQESRTKTAALDDSWKVAPPGNSPIQHLC